MKNIYNYKYTFQINKSLVIYKKFGENHIFSSKSVINSEERECKKSIYIENHIY